MSTSYRVFPYFQSESAIFDKGNFLYHTPNSNNLLNIRELYLHALLWVDQNREHTQRLFNKEGEKRLKNSVWSYSLKLVNIWTLVNSLREYLISSFLGSFFPFFGLFSPILMNSTFFGWKISQIEKLTVLIIISLM